jgi:hypothetical protein
MCVGLPPPAAPPPAPPPSPNTRTPRAPQVLKASSCGLRPGSTGPDDAPSEEGSDYDSDSSDPGSSGPGSQHGPPQPTLGPGALAGALAGCTVLEELCVDGNRRLRTLEGVGALGGSLTQLNAAGCGLADLRGLLEPGNGGESGPPGATRLARLQLRGNPGISDLAPLALLPALEEAVVDAGVPVPPGLAAGPASSARTVIVRPCGLG